MTKRLMGMLMMWAVVAVGANAQTANPSEKNGNAAGDFSATSGSQASLLSTETVSRDFALSSSEAANAMPEAAAVPAAKPAKPRFVFGDRDDYRWQLGVGVEFFRFQSNVIDASMVGLNTTLTYYTNSWFALEGNLITGFAPEIYDREHVKLWGGSGGFRIGGRRQKWEPWAHALVGGAHLQPQTAGASRNALMAQAGLGVDYRVHQRLSFRVEGDWVYTDFFHDMQNNFQGVAGVVLHF